MVGQGVPREGAGLRRAGPRQGVLAGQASLLGIRVEDMVRRVRGLVDELAGTPFHPREQQESGVGIVLRFLGWPCEFGGDCAYPGLGWRCGHRGLWRGPWRWSR